MKRKLLELQANSSANISQCPLHDQLTVSFAVSASDLACRRRCNVLKYVCLYLEARHRRTNRKRDGHGTCWGWKGAELKSLGLKNGRRKTREIQRTRPNVQASWGNPSAHPFTTPVSTAETWKETEKRVGRLNEDGESSLILSRQETKTLLSQTKKLARERERERKRVEFNQREGIEMGMKRGRAEVGMKSCWMPGHSFK